MERQTELTRKAIKSFVDEYRSTESIGQRSNMICNISGRHNRFLRQEIVRYLLGKKLSVNQCGVNYIEKLLKAKRD